MLCLYVCMQASRGRLISVQMAVKHQVVAGWTHDLWKNSHLSSPTSVGYYSRQYKQVVHPKITACFYFVIVSQALDPGRVHRRPCASAAYETARVAYTFKRIGLYYLVFFLEYFFLLLTIDLRQDSIPEATHFKVVDKLGSKSHSWPTRSQNFNLWFDLPMGFLFSL